MTKVSFLAATLKTGGAERQFLELAKGIDRDRFGVVLICLYELGEFGVQIRESGIRSYFDLLKHRFSFRSIRKLAEILRREKIDVVFLWNTPLTMIYGIAAAKMAGLHRIVAVVHNTGYVERKFRTDMINRLLMRFVKKVVATGLPHKDYIVRKEHVPVEKIEVIYNGVEIKNYELSINKQKKKEELGIPRDTKVVGIVARLHKAKRHDVFLTAAKSILAEYENVHFIIVGEGDERERVAGLIARLDLARHVELLGLRKDIAEIYHVLDVAVLSSDPLVETMPLAVIEAMSSSVPVVATNVGSLSDMVIDGDNGFLVEPGAAEDLAKAVLKLLKDGGLAARMGRRGHEIACEKFSREAMVKGYEALFTDPS